MNNTIQFENREIIIKLNKNIYKNTLDKMKVLAYNKDNKNKEREKTKNEKKWQKKLRRGGTDHRERKFRLAFKTSLI